MPIIERESFTENASFFERVSFIERVLYQRFYYTCPVSNSIPFSLVLLTSNLSLAYNLLHDSSLQIFH